jgi:hypothetical protein
MLAHTCNPGTQEVEAGGQPGLHSETVSQKTKGWSVTQWVEHLLSMCKSLSVIPSTMGEKKANQPTKQKNLCFLGL